MSLVEHLLASRMPLELAKLAVAEAKDNARLKNLLHAARHELFWIRVAEETKEENVNHTEKLRLAREALEMIANCTGNSEAFVRLMRDWVNNGLRAIATPSAPAAAGPSIITAEFYGCLEKWAKRWTTDKLAGPQLDALVAHIDAWGAAQREAGALVSLQNYDAACSEYRSQIAELRERAEKAEAALAQRTAPAPTPMVYPEDGTVSPFTVINLGAGKVKIGDSIHDGRLPALWFGKDGTGMGDEEVMNRAAKDGETLAVVTFASVEGLDVLAEVVARIRRERFPDALPPVAGDDAWEYDLATHDKRMEILRGELARLEAEGAPAPAGKNGPLLIARIKRYRAAFGCTIKEAKEACEAGRDLNADQTEFLSPAAPVAGGCGACGDDCKGQQCRVERDSPPVTGGDVTDAQRLDHMEAWREKSKDQGFVWNSYDFALDIPIRQQLANAIRREAATSAALAQQKG